LWVSGGGKSAARKPPKERKKKLQSGLINNRQSLVKVLNLDKADNQ
jgi:hypothetical protein